MNTPAVCFSIVDIMDHCLTVASRCPFNKCKQSLPQLTPLKKRCKSERSVINIQYVNHVTINSNLESVILRICEMCLFIVLGGLGNWLCSVTFFLLFWNYMVRNYSKLIELHTVVDVFLANDVLLHFRRISWWVWLEINCPYSLYLC